MKATLLFVIAASFLASVLADYSDIKSCTFTTSKGKKYDLSPLISSE